MVARRAGTVSAATLFGLVLSLVFTDLVAPRWVQAVGLDVWNIGTLRDEVRGHDEQAAIVEAQRIRIIREAEASGRVAERLAAGKISLAAAVDELEPTLRHRVGFECAWPNDRPPTFRHAVARYAITRVEADLTPDPERQAVVVARLLAEYADLR
ncbi:hypothetical protein [Gemmata sp.]|uniref:hypothetical protein n=1 Tax=Gemmata sp. TaxID=1914242 RepID=UPI003F6F7D98